MAANGVGELWFYNGILSIWYLKYQIPSPKKYLEKYLNTQKLTCIWYFI